MTISSQDYAALADDAHKDRAVGRREPGQEEKVYLNGQQYKVLEHVDDRRTGYQGTVYQRVNTQEIIVSHRPVRPPWPKMARHPPDDGFACPI